MKTILAIDPGSSGGVAVAHLGHVEAQAMPATQGDLLDLVRSIKAAADVDGHETVCVLEEVGGFVGQAQPGSAMFKFGEHYGFAKGVVQTLGIPLVLVRPQIWQKGFGLGTASNCASKSEWKNKLKAEAQRRFPHLTVSLKTADALLILDWFVRAENGALRGANGDSCHSSLQPTDGARGATRPTNQLNGAHGVRRPT